MKRPRSVLVGRDSQVERPEQLGLELVQVQAVLLWRNRCRRGGYRRTCRRPRLADATREGIRHQDQSAHAHPEFDAARFAIRRALMLRLELTRLHVSGATGSQSRCKNAHDDREKTSIRHNPSASSRRIAR